MKATPIDNFFEKEPNKLLTLRHRTNVFIANDELTERKIAVMASELGYNNIEILKGGLIEFTGEILGFDGKLTRPFDDFTIQIWGCDSEHLYLDRHQNKTMGLDSN